MAVHAQLSLTTSLKWVSLYSGLWLVSCWLTCNMQLAATGIEAMDYLLDPKVACAKETKDLIERPFSKWPENIQRPNKDWDVCLDLYDVHLKISLKVLILFTLGIRRSVRGQLPGGRPVKNLFPADLHSPKEKGSTVHGRLSRPQQILCRERLRQLCGVNLIFAPWTLHTLPLTTFSINPFYIYLTLNGYFGSLYDAISITTSTRTSTSITN